jgi:hypothetical protein
MKQKSKPDVAGHGEAWQGVAGRGKARQGYLIIEEARA